MNEKIEVPTMKVPPIKKICMTIGQLPASYVETMSYYEMLVWFVHYLRDDIIPVVNANGEATQELQELFVELQNYVNNYFDNLDVQDEVDNKLNQMLEDGVLEQIIEQFLQSSALWCFDTINDMKEATNLISGSYARTLGYHAINDEGGAIYRITDEESENEYQEELGDNLYATLIVNGTILPQMMGAYADGTHDDTTAIQNAIDYAINKRLKLIFSKTYIVTPTLREDGSKVCLTIARNGVSMWSNPCEIEFIGGACIKTEANEECVLLRMNSSNMIINNLFLRGGEYVNLLQLSRIDLLDVTEEINNNRNSFNNTKLSGGNQALELQGGAYYNTFNKMTINGCKNAILLGFTQLEKNGLHQDPSTNRNDFLNVTVLNSTQSGVRIEYGDTNKFVDLNFEGVKNPVYIDDPHKHSSDFPISALYYPYDNMFVNLTQESTTGIPIYNNCEGTKIINTSERLIKANFPILPHMFIGGVSYEVSTQCFADLYLQRTTSKIYPSSVDESAVLNNNGGFASRSFYDFRSISDGADIEPMKLTNTTFDLPANSNIESITYETNDKALFKSIGNILKISAKFKFKPVDNTASIKIDFPAANSWITSNTSITTFGDLPNLSIPIYVKVVDDWKLTRASITGSEITIIKPDGNWNSGNYNFVFINFSIFRNRSQN